MPNRGDFSVFDDDYSVRDSLVGGEHLAGVYDECIHGGLYGTRTETQCTTARTCAFPKSNAARIAAVIGNRNSMASTISPLHWNPPQPVCI
jgi:hypothetical protein